MTTVAEKQAAVIADGRRLKGTLAYKNTWYGATLAETPAEDD